MSRGMGREAVNVKRKGSPGGRILKDELIPQRNNEHPAENVGCSFAYGANKCNAPERCVSLRPPYIMGNGFLVSSTNWDLANYYTY
jgi:hypothetical protein